MFNLQAALKEYIRHPSVSADSSCHDGMEGSRQYISGLLAGLGFSVETVQTPLHPIVLAERGGDENWPHVIVYGHYDVQPPDPLELWTSPPFDPILRDGRLYGRGAADNKGPQLVHVAAIAQLLEKHPSLPLRLTFLIEGEEEIGSPSFPGFLEQYSGRLKGDFVLLSDTLSPDIDQIAITTGLRGIVCLEVKLTGPKMDLHSGIYGGALLNPIQALADLCASLHTPDRRVNIDGFYDDILEPQNWEREELDRLDNNMDKYRDFLGVTEFFTVEGYSPFEATRFAPTLDFNGIGGGYQGEGSKTIIPSAAFAKISCRLVPNQKPDKIQQLLVQTLRERCPAQVKLDIDLGHCGAPYLVVPPGKENTPAGQSPVLNQAFSAAHHHIGEIFGKPPVYLREGGSVPIIADLKRVTGLDSLMIGMFTPEDNLHAPDESVHISMLEKGVEVSMGILANLAGVNSD